MVLEVAPGPGYFCIELAKLGAYSITGLDISQLSSKSRAGKPLKQASAWTSAKATLPACLSPTIPSTSSCAARPSRTLRQPVRALQEMCRVLKPGGRGLIIDLRKDASMESINHEVDGMGLNRGQQSH